MALKVRGTVVISGSFGGGIFRYNEAISDSFEG